MNLKRCFIFAVVCVITSTFCLASIAQTNDFIAVRPEADFKLSGIVLQYNPQTKTGLDWDTLSKLNYYRLQKDPAKPAVDAVQYLQEAVQKMTGRKLPVASSNNVSYGIVLVLMKDAPLAIGNDPHIQKALRNTGEDSYNANEAFYIRSDANRVLIVANTYDGLSDGVVALLESVGYEVLGMGPDWINVPDYHHKPLLFSIEKTDRPGFYIRNLWATSGQSYGVGTLTKVADAADETVPQSYQRWRIGTHMATESMPDFPGHALQAYHRAVIEKMKETQTPYGFMVKKTVFGLDAQRPAAAIANDDFLWIDTDAKGQPAAGKVLLSNGKKWVEQNLANLGTSLDLSVLFVRRIILDDLKKKSADYFAQHPNDIFIFDTNPEDGAGYANMGTLAYDKNWYPQYLKSQGMKFGQPYVLNGLFGLNQPREIWDPGAPADTVFGFNNWLLHEYDKWIDSLPPADRLTSTGKSKKDLVRASLYSYAYFDVPPDFNLDPRIRIMLAGYAKHRGRGKWKNFATHEAIGAAFHKLLPREPSGDYWITSYAYGNDYTTAGIRGSHLPALIWNRVEKLYKAGFRAISCETDFNFGKQGLEYYLYTKVLWHPQMTLADLQSLRDRWLQRSFGSGWREMKTYYDFMAPENFTLNSPHNWAIAIRMIDAADQQIDGAKEPDAQRRIDDLKQFWYFYYLVASKQATPTSPALKEFVWKGQMSYMTAMHMVMRRYCGTTLGNSKPANFAGPQFNTGPAHYTHAETQAWWTKVLSFWKETPVDDFADATLANGVKAKTIDLNNLVAVAQFGEAPPVQPFIYNSGEQKEARFLTVATHKGQAVGCKLLWPWLTNYSYNNYERNVSYGVSAWDAGKKEWVELANETAVSVPGKPFKDSNGKEWRVAEISFAAPHPGTYRIDVGKAGNLAQLASLDYNPQTGKYNGNSGMTFPQTQEGLTQRPTYFYIPKGVKSIDLEVWRSFGKTQLTLHTGLPAAGMKTTRTVDVTSVGTHKVPLQPGEDGSLAAISGNGFAFPYLYSVPMLWAKSPSQLLAPRAIAEADGLTIEK